MDKIKIGYDDNLGLPSDFATTLGYEIVPYHDLGAMVADFEKKKLLSIFIPAGTLPYLKNYEVISQSLFGPEKKNVLQTNFVTTEKVTIEEIPKLTLGRVNQYCTTSFWAPSIYLMKFFPKGTTLTFKNANSFPDMLHKTAEGQLDCSMVWDIIIKQHPQDAAKVHELFQKNDLPTPIFISAVGAAANFKEKLNQFMTQDKKSFFAGFQAPNLSTINQFLLDMENAKNYFQIKLS